MHPMLEGVIGFHGAAHDGRRSLLLAKYRPLDESVQADFPRPPAGFLQTGGGPAARRSPEPET